MANTGRTRNTPDKSKARGRVKISEAVKHLLREKAYNDITWGEIAKTAGVSQALIYQHFRDRQGLLYSVIEDLLEEYVFALGKSLQGTYGARNKLRWIIQNQFHYYNQDRVFAKILLLEVRSYPLFFESGAYRIIQEYSGIILDIIKEGVYSGEIRNDLAPEHIRQMILGTIEHLCLPKVVFGRTFSAEELTDDACRMIFPGIQAGSPSAL